MVRGLPPWARGIADALGEAGINVVGVADGAPFDEILPGCRAVLVFGSGGRALWDALLAEIRADPRRLTDEQHPQDAFVARVIAAADPDPPASRRWVCVDDESVFVDFRRLAIEAGLGWDSLLGLTLHPEYGPWIGLRAACFVTEALPATGPLAGVGPCEGCPAPCRPACPGEAMPAGGIDIGRCAAFHFESDACLGVCHARNACPVGADHAHSELEHRYHADRPTGRLRLAASLGITGDKFRGLGPNWGGAVQ